ncbi:hypothetical protein ABZ234_03875 [Nocardiopsis sp. NPDC006198]|uniref:hypothetical protein n=1 Tax=Nocardiopsis sp. NPDC006198 TaxID=3154472 RepID=UPI0033A8EF42
MGTSTDAILAYGYDFGNGEDWLVREVSEYGDLAVDWYDSEAEDLDFVEAVEAKLLAAAGFTEADWQVDGYFERKRDALATFGVEVVSHCSIDYPMYILAAHSTTARRGAPEAVDLADMSALQEDADARLARALEALGLTPMQDKPAWLLASDWG